MGAEVGRDLGVQIERPVQPLGNRLDHQVATGQQVQVLVVVGGLNQGQVGDNTDRRRLEFFQAVQRLQHNTVLRKIGRRGPCPVFVLGRQIKQQHRHADIDQVGGDLRAHHAGAEHGHLAHVESIHVDSVDFKGTGRPELDRPAATMAVSSAYSARIQVWVRPSSGMPT